MQSNHETPAAKDDAPFVDPLTIPDDRAASSSVDGTTCRTTAFTKVDDLPSGTCTVVTSIHQLLEQGKRFACVYADLPWLIGDDNQQFVTAFSQLPVHQLVEEHAHLHLWATNDSLFAAKSVMENWGFEFKGCLVCLNSDGRPGNHWVEAHEYLLLGTRGGLPLMEHTLNSWMRGDRDQAGRASERVRKLIERVSPGPYLDLFGRQRANGWTICSNLLDSVSDSSSGEELNASNRMPSEGSSSC